MSCVSFLDRITMTSAAATQPARSPYQKSYTIKVEHIVSGVCWATRRDRRIHGCSGWITIHEPSKCVDPARLGKVRTPRVNFIESSYSLFCDKGYILSKYRELGRASPVARFCGPYVRLSICSLSTESESNRDNPWSLTWPAHNLPEPLRYLVWICAL